MEKRKHYEGLNDQQVVESRAKYGVLPRMWNTG